MKQNKSQQIQAPEHTILLFLKLSYHSIQKFLFFVRVGPIYGIDSCFEGTSRFWRILIRGLRSMRFGSWVLGELSEEQKSMVVLATCFRRAAEYGAPGS
jgi:hypothetical protein